LLRGGGRHGSLQRAALLQRAFDPGERWDILVIGGGATGVGIAVDAASRGYRTLLLEQQDFGKGTSSRSTKLIHGGVRYLRQGNLGLVMEALRERGRLARNAPHLVYELGFVVPAYTWWERPFYGLGLSLYDVLAGGGPFAATRLLSKKETLKRLPTLRAGGLRGGVLYSDGQFDDARLLIALVLTAIDRGAVALNYVRVIGLTRGADSRVTGVIAQDAEAGATAEIAARVVINATGPFCDEVRRLAEAAALPMITPSQGLHLVFDRSFLPGDHALMVPETPDGRVMFAIPWQGHTLIGTTDTAVEETTLEPRPHEAEIDFILETAGRYLERAPTRGDVLSAFVGIRPLVRQSRALTTAALSRDHTISVEPSGLVTITGGKWTTYRRMAEDCVDRAAPLAGLPPRRCVTRSLLIHGHHEDASSFGPLAVYGNDAYHVRDLIQKEPELGTPLHPAFSYCGAEVVWAARREFARTVEDVLARRTRALFLNARAAVEMAPRVAELLAHELGRDAAWQRQQVEDFARLAEGYMVTAS
jgi:glycerol-3-phosphate dehydrogenase